MIFNNYSIISYIFVSNEIRPFYGNINNYFMNYIYEPNVHNFLKNIAHEYSMRIKYLFYYYIIFI